MNFIQLKIQRDNSVVKYIRIIRNFDSSLSIGTIKQKIEENDFAIVFDLDDYNALEDIQGIDRKIIFQEMIETLIKTGAQISIYHNGELISVELLDNWLKTIDVIRQQTEKDMNRESK